MNYTDPSGNVAISLLAGLILERVVDTAIETFVDVLIDMVLEGESFCFGKSAVEGVLINIVPFAGEVSTSKKLAKLSTKYGDDIVLALKNTDEIVKHADEIIEVANKDGVKGLQRYLSTFGKGIKGMSKLSDEAIDFSVSSQKRLQHAYKHASDLGFGNWNKQNAGLWKNYITDTLKNATKTFDNKLGNDAVQGFYRVVDGNDVAVYLYKEGANKGLVASVVKLSENQLVKFGLK